MTGMDLERKIDSMMGEFVSPDGPGVALLIGREDRVLLRKAYGLANVEKGERLTPDHRFIMASVTKQFVGMAIMLLKYRGLLDYDEPIARFFPDYPVWKDRITLRHLLQQTSGLQEYLTGAFWQKAVDQANSMELDDLLAEIKSFKELEFEPGSRWRYCNSNYILLGSIVEKASNMGFRAFMQENILDPVGMKRSFAGDSGEMPEMHATGYEYKSKTEFKQAPFTREVVGWADGNIISAVDDMFLWAQSLSTGQILPLSAKAQAFVPWNALNPDETRYGFGQMIGERRGVREVHHSGGTLGFNTRLSRFTDEKLSVILLSNASGIGVEKIMGAIAEALLGDKMLPLMPVQLPAEFLAEKVGKYTGKPRDHQMALQVIYSPETAALTASLSQDTEGTRSNETSELVPLGRDLYLMNKRADKYLVFTREGREVTGVQMRSVGSVTNLPNKVS